MVAIVALIAASLGIWSLSNSRTYQVAGTLVARVDTAEPVVALTFDDGPVAERVEPLLAQLREANVRATFFVIGEQLAAHPESGRRLLAAGHELGNHSYTHTRMVFNSAGFYAREIEETDAQIRAAGQQGPIVFRPPYGKKLIGLPLYLARTDRTSVTWDVEPETDAAGATPDQLTARSLEQVRPGSIILLHPWYAGSEQTRQAIGPIIAGLRERGYRFVTVSELLALRR
jgi:peptidoglycan/xylan/chitin deacetylase (PgdA/CDA1 family)